MRNRNNVEEEKSAVKIECRHYWVIEAADGPVSRGVCKFCGEKKEFLNSWSDASYKGKDAKVFDLPDMLEDEVEAEDDS
jgi:hypothetical protein